MIKSPMMLLSLLILTACSSFGLSQPLPVEMASTPLTVTTSLPPSPSLTITPTLTSTQTPTYTGTPTISHSPTITSTSTITPTPTFVFPEVMVKVQAHCRYGPARAFLHAADLYPGDHGTVRGRYRYSAWLYVKFDKLKYFCWVSPSVIEVTGDITKIYFTEPRLPGPSALYPPPNDVQAIRDGTQVTVSWSRVSMTEDDDRGYLLDIFVCQQGNLVWWPVALSDQYQTTHTFIDEPGCSQPSGGVLYTVEKHGYSHPVVIPWPSP